MALFVMGARCWFVVSLFIETSRPFSGKLLPSLYWCLGLYLPRAGPRISLCRTAWASCWPISPACPAPCGWQCPHLAYSHSYPLCVTCRRAGQTLWRTMQVKLAHCETEERYQFPVAARNEYMHPNSLQNGYTSSLLPGGKQGAYIALSNLRHLETCPWWKNGNFKNGGRRLLKLGNN